MEQICKFDSQPQTICNGGYKKGRWIVWLNLGIVVNVSSVIKIGTDDWAFMAHTDRLVLTDNSIDGFLAVVDPIHLSLATAEELETILQYFNASDDIESWRKITKVQIQGYDNSNGVNQFFINDIPLWLDKATRVGLVNSVTTEKNAGRENTCLWFGDINIQMPVEKALYALSQLELYALDCYNVTAQHLTKVAKLETIEELRDFDIASDYPAMLNFSI